MDLVNLMNALSVSEPVEERTACNFHVYAAVINGVHTDLVYGVFTNKYMVIATQYEKVGSLLKVTVDEAENGIEISSPIYSIVSLFGAEDINQQAAARYLAEKLNIRKPMMLFLCLKDYETETVKALAEALLNVPDKQ